MNVLQQLGLGLVAVAAMTASTQALSNGLHDKHVFQRNYRANVPGTNITFANASFSSYSDSHSYNPNYFTVNTSLKASASVFGKAPVSYEIFSNGWELGPRGRAVSGLVRVNGKSIFNHYRSVQGSNSASIKYSDRISKELARAKRSFGVGPIVATVSAGIDGVLRPGFEAATANPSPYDTRNGWVRIIHRNDVGLHGDVSAGVDFLVAGIGVKGSVRLISVGNGSGSNDTKVTLKRTSTGNYYYNSAIISYCTLGGTLDAWVSLAGNYRTYKTRLLNKQGFCYNRGLHNINTPISYSYQPRFAR